MDAELKACLDGVVETITLRIVEQGSRIERVEQRLSWHRPHDDPPPAASHFVRLHTIQSVTDPFRGGAGHGTPPR